MGKLNKSQIIRTMNYIAEQANKPELKIDMNASSSTQNEQFQILQVVLDSNFIMTNIDNVIKKQIYSDLKNGKLMEKDFGFWFTGEQGDEIVYENSIDGSQRDGDIASDLAKISAEPENETQVLQLTRNWANDQKRNAQLQAFASLDKATSWVNKRYENQKNSLDKKLHSETLIELNAYTGYSEVFVDTTGFDEEQTAKAFEIVIGEEISSLGNNYSNTKNNLGFDNLEDPADIGLIFSTKASVNRKVNYLRKVVNPDGEMDWGVGHIISKPLDEEQQVILLPKSKYIGGVIYGSLPTYLGFALIEELNTEYAFWGSIFMESAPAVRITGGTPAAYKEKLTLKKEKFGKLLEIALKEAKENKAKLDAANKLLAVNQIEKLIEFNNKIDIEKIISNARIHKINPNDLTTKVTVVNGHATLPHGVTSNKDEKELQDLQHKLAETEKALAAAEASNEQNQIAKEALTEKIKETKAELKKLKKAQPVTEAE